MTKLIGFGRCLGKTTMAILESHATGNRILVANQKMAENTFRMAHELGYAIPYPICVNDLVRTPHVYSTEEHLIIDNVEMVLREMLHNKIDTITFDNRTIDPEDRYLEEIKTLKQEVDACYKEKTKLYQDIHDKAEHIERLKRSNIELTQALSDTIYTDMRAKARYRQQGRKWRAREKGGYKMKLKYRDSHIIKSKDDSLVLDLDQNTLTMPKHSGAGGDYGTTEDV